jgi:hypothetical protein
MWWVHSKKRDFWGEDLSIKLRTPPSPAKVDLARSLVELEFPSVLEDFKSFAIIDPPAVLTK